MKDELSQFYLQQEEPLKSALLALRDIILAANPTIKSAWKYGCPFFVYQGKNLCYLWIDKKTQHPYIGFIAGHQLDHPLLNTGDRKQIKVLPIDPTADFPMEALQEILAQALEARTNRE